MVNAFEWNGKGEAVETFTPLQSKGHTDRQGRHSIDTYGVETGLRQSRGGKKKVLKCSEVDTLTLHNTV
jgi:hypothetical protein